MVEDIYMCNNLEISLLHMKEINVTLLILNTHTFVSRQQIGLDSKHGNMFANTISKTKIQSNSQILEAKSIYVSSRKALDHGKR